MSESGIVVASSCSIYLSIAMLLDFRYFAFDGDAISRMANGFYVIHSRDPHLAAVGFVWNPLSSVADLPLLMFNSVWPALASHNVAGTTVSALAMTGAVYQLHSILREWNVPTAPRLILTTLFALNPMILLFGGNGMSEALYLFTMLATTRYLLKWLKSGATPPLVYAAIALAFAYLERSEPIAAAALATPLVFWVTFLRSEGNRRPRIWSGLTDVTLLLFPIITAFVGLAVVSYVITGQPFEQFTSKYGNAALISASHQAKLTLAERLVHEGKAISYMAPVLILIVAVAAYLAIRRRDIQILGVIAILGGGLAFTLLSYATNSIFPWYRYYILVAPIEVLLVGSMFLEPVRSSSPRPKSGLFAAGALLVSTVLLGPSIPGTAMAMNNVTMAPDVLLYYGFIFHIHPDAQDRASAASYGAVRTMADYFDEKRLANGDVVVDTSDNCIPNVVTNVGNPRIFVIHNDRDFQRTLDDPITFHAHYLMVQGSGSTQTDAVGQQYPSLGRGASWAELVHHFPARGLCTAFSLYRVTGHSSGNF